VSPNIQGAEVVMTKKILVVDDEADVRRFLTAVLEKKGHETLTAADGREALEIAEREKPNLVILDLQMPDQTGTDFYRRLKRNKEMKDIPIIVVSGLAGRHLAVSDPFAVFDKPIDPDEFTAAVERALGEHDD
jgi:CheY-like chemotaxis protein